MRLNAQHLNIRSLDTLDSWLEQQILALDQHRQIDEAHVRLVRVTRRKLRAARRNSTAFARDSVSFPSITPWQRGGSNE